MAYKDFTEMSFWQKAFDILVKVYVITHNFPAEKKYGITSDMRRAANSVAHNIAEGFGRYEKRDKPRFYIISRGSTYETQSQLLPSFALGFIQDEDLKTRLFDDYKSVIMELDALIKTLES